MYLIPLGFLYLASAIGSIAAGLGLIGYGAWMLGVPFVPVVVVASSAVVSIVAIVCLALYIWMLVG